MTEYATIHSTLSREEIANIALPFLTYPLNTTMTMRGHDIIDFALAIVDAVNQGTCANIPDILHPTYATQ